ncbi:OPT family oligopeptide transporter [Thermosediminibacter litoriperuensis]|uniref:Putative OPT family oligopeptide transporter n=1 Tax=Thermosediminibacter litoriperuensis TaxID=291989 RepID=A0A5S5AJC1_9FIRM|nr:oligopeptide transporter, OPT family [Thermosediminibacter litoriperuensis]TYP49782.1 putative OPT family oligopeptide transporter [Thermosediminibacter litoriperuensis]
MEKKKGLSKQAYSVAPGEEYVPYIPAEQSMTELTTFSFIVGIILAIVFGAANAYLGLRVGMTVSASIPAAVVSMGIVRGILKRDSILENNMVQTIASAGESLAAGVIFTVPALFLWKTNPSIMRISTIAIIGGVLGVLMMIPLRRFLIVKEHGVLPYPEGTACAEVLVAGEVGGVSAKTVFEGLGIGALYKLLADGLKLFPSEIEWKIPGFKGAAIGADILPALLGVGFIIGPTISAYMLAGAVLGWFAFIPLISHLGNYIPQAIYPASVPISELDHWGIWSYYLRYIGAGAVTFGGFVSLVKALPTIVNAFSQSISGFSIGGNGSKLRTSEDLPMKWVLLGVLIIIIAIAFSPLIPVGVLGAVLIVIFGFFFVTVSSRIVGIVGSSSNPVSGMTIATLLFTTILFKATGFSGIEGMIAALTVGGVICVAAAIAGDTSQDLKTGFLVGATPKLQQIGELVGVTASGLVIGWILIMLNNAYGFGSKDIPAPQATLMKMVIEGIMNGNLPWPLVFVGFGSAAVIELFGIASLPFAIGLYLPIHLSTPIMLGGIIRGILERKEKSEEVLKQKVEKGILYSSGLIAGEGIMGILIAALVAANIDPDIGNNVLGQWGGLVLFMVLTYTLISKAFKKPELE